ncbi:MAG: hypothetical protein BMS9Abin05_1171 [Rhodothermia bacterium]|nr:MAG: hypothetical protein BMS9Abin05_1171 [Rhodothermia bacterium]
MIDPKHLNRFFLVATVAIGSTWFAACDSGISGDLLANQPPETTLSVRDSSLVDNLAGADRLASTVLVSWSGDDPDGFVQSYEVRFYDVSENPLPNSGWTSTARTDSLVLLPIERGERTANVVFEARAIDNQGEVDPTPARTVFPIENGPPSIRFSPFDVPPDTTFPIVTFSWIAEDPEGRGNLASIDVSFNDSMSFVSLPSDTEFATFRGEVDIGDASQLEVEGRVFLGRGYNSTSIFVPGWRMDAENTFYLRAVDATDTTSVRQEFTWFTKRQTSDILYVNDFRLASNPTVQAFHLGLLQEYVGANEPIDVWTITTPFVSGSAGNVPRSDLLPPNANPTLRRMLENYKYIYWVSTNTTNRITGNNLPFAASVTDLFFENGGKMMVHSPISLPANPEDNLGNAAILLLPLSEMITFPDSLRQQLRLPTNAAVSPVSALPAVATPLPILKSGAFLINTLPFVILGSNSIPLYEAEYRYVTRAGQQGPWSGPATIASISTDQRVGLFALPLVNDQSGAQILIGADGDTEAPKQAIKLMLESLGFPKR